MRSKGLGTQAFNDRLLGFRVLGWCRVSRLQGLGFRVYKLKA